MFVSINGKKIHFKRVGEDLKITPLFIHGAGANLNVWEFQMSECEGIYIDLPGHGKSEGEGEKDIDNYSQFIKDFIDTMNLKKVVLVGHSMGGAIALNYAVKYQENLAGLVLVATGPTLKVDPRFLDGLKGDLNNTIKMISKYAFMKGISKALLRRLKDIMLSTKPDVIYQDFFACSLFDKRDDIYKIKNPTMIIAGERDLLTPLELSLFMLEKIPKAHLVVIPDAGHMVMIEKAKDFNKEFLSFINEI